MKISIKYHSVDRIFFIRDPKLIIGWGCSDSHRVCTDLALARSENSPQRFYSMSSAIRAHRKGYYKILERTQKGGLDITKWLEWFLNCLNGAFDQAEDTLSTVLTKAEFWNLHRDTPLNKRQKEVINRLLDGFIGKLTSSKWAKLTKTSHDTASRDIDDLIKNGILVRGPAGGRSTSYELVISTPKQGFDESND